MKKTVIKVALTSDDMQKIHRLIEERPGVTTPEEALLWLLRIYAAAKRPSSGSVKAPGTPKKSVPFQTPGIPKKSNPFQTPGIPWDISNEKIEKPDRSGGKGPWKVESPF